MPQEEVTVVSLKADNLFDLQRRFLNHHNVAPALRSSHQLRRCFDVWDHIVSTYSGGRLTYGGDKLLAISALAREMKPLMQCRYLAGHWETDLIRQLGWPGYDVLKRAAKYRAPSWAWTSMDGRNYFFKFMYYLHDRFYPLAEILESHVDLASEDEFGLVEGGYLEVRGKLLLTTPHSYNEEEQGIDLTSSGNRSFGKPLLIQETPTILRFHQDGNDPEPGIPLYCMPLSLRIEITDDDKLWFSGLML